MTQRDRDYLTESDPHGLVLGPHDGHADDPTAVHPIARPTRATRRRMQREHEDRRRHQRNSRLLIALAVVIVTLVAGGAYLYVRSAIEVKDYSGNGTTPVTVTVSPGDPASVIAQTLADADVVASAEAFTNAANDDPDSQNIQPGTYTLRKHMSARNALAMLLDPSARSADRDVVVTEGATTLDVARRLAKALKVSEDSVLRAIQNVGNLGVPSTYSAGGRAPRSLEGFLYPATYTVDPGATVEETLTQMINAFIEQDRSTGFAANAKAMGHTPYEALIIASIARSEAKYAADLPKVVRVILNRLAAGRPLQIDATSVYGARLMGLDPHTVVFSELESPYNTYHRAGLTPTPISNPGAEAMAAVLAPARGDWTYYVNGDEQGHLFFTNNEAEFLQAVERCRDNNWGCG